MHKRTRVRAQEQHVGSLLHSLGRYEMEMARYA